MLQAWTKPEYKHKAKNVHCLIERLNNLTLWVATVILSYTEDYERAKAITAFVKIAYVSYAYRIMQNNLINIFDRFNECILIASIPSTQLQHTGSYILWGTAWIYNEIIQNME